jgi:hypothetical protein
MSDVGSKAENINSIRVIPVLTDAVEKVFWGDIRKFSKAADAFYARRREGPHRVSEKRPRTFVSALQSIAAAE